MRIAHLILAHSDPVHIGRLVRRLASFSDVFVHIDASKNVDEYINEVGYIENCFFVSNRIHCSWGGWNAVVAEMNLIEKALECNKYDRLVFLQGADYLLKADDEIVDFFKQNEQVEFVRACCCTSENDPYFWDKCRYYLFYNNKNLLKRIANKLVRLFRLKIRDGYIYESGKKYEVYWGSAQWAITSECATHVLDFYKKHNQFNRWFLHAFPADELYVPTVVMNSKFRELTTAHGPEKAIKGLTNWRNLHYFEYLPGSIKIFKSEDYLFLKSRKELYIRKVNSADSKDLLDLLDEDNMRVQQEKHLTS